jgi:hypothetical protein
MMKLTRNLFRIAALASVLAAAPFAGTLSAAPATQKTGRLGIDPMAMSPDGNFAFENDWATGLTNTYNCFNAGINLPQGAKITNVAIAYNSPGADPSPDHRVYVELRRKMFSTGQTENIGARIFPRTNGSRTLSKLPTPNGETTPIDNLKYTYGIGVCMGAVQNSFYGARILYTYTD